MRYKIITRNTVTSFGIITFSISTTCHIPFVYCS